MAIYTSEYSGSEIDEAVGRVLGHAYEESVDPGCHLIGKESANPQNLYEVTLPGKYTILFYYDADENGPISLSNIASVPSLTGEAEYASIEGNSPIFMTVTYSGNHHYQRITIGAALFWRDLLNADNHNWTYVNMGVTQTVIVDHLHSTSASEALSGNMGRELKSIIDNLEIGNYNLISNSGLVRDASCWNIPSYDSADIFRDEDFKFCGHPTFNFMTYENNTSYASIANSMAYDAPVEAGITYTGSVYVKSNNDTDVFLQISFLDSTKTVIQGAETLKITIPAGSWKRLKVTKENTSGEYVRISFGVKGEALSLFALPKVEAGYYATQWMPSYYDMWCEFDNANYINEVLVDTDNLMNHDGLVYIADSNSFINYPVARGGGGGVIQSALEPAYHEVLWYRIGETANNFYVYDTDNDQWGRAFPSFFAQQNDAPADKERGWLDTTKASSSVPATLNYYDTTLNKWRPIGAAPGVNWVFSETPPENTGLIWIQIPNFIMKLWYDGAWVPIHAIWGTDITST